MLERCAIPERHSVGLLRRQRQRGGVEPQRRAVSAHGRCVRGVRRRGSTSARSYRSGHWCCRRRAAIGHAVHHVQHVVGDVYATVRADDHIHQSAPGAAACEPPAAVRAKALRGGGRLALDLEDLERGIIWFEESRVLCEQLSDKVGLAWSLDNLAYAARSQGDFTQALVYLEERKLRRSTASARLSTQVHQP